MAATKKQTVNPLKHNSFRKIVLITATIIVALLLLSSIINLLLIGKGNALAQKRYYAGSIRNRD